MRRWTNPLPVPLETTPPLGVVVGVMVRTDVLVRGPPGVGVEVEVDIMGGTVGEVEGGEVDVDVELVFEVVGDEAGVVVVVVRWGGVVVVVVSVVGEVEEVVEVEGVTAVVVLVDGGGVRGVRGTGDKWVLWG